MANVEDKRETLSYIERNGPIHTIDSEISFQRIKDLPKKSKYYGNHKRLHWICERDVHKFEKDTKMVTLEMERSQSFYKQKLKDLQDTKKNLKKTEILLHSKSCTDIEDNIISKPVVKFEKLECPHESDDENHDSQEELVPPPKLMGRRFTMPNLTQPLCSAASIKMQKDFW